MEIEFIVDSEKYIAQQGDNETWHVFQQNDYIGSLIPFGEDFGEDFIVDDMTLWDKIVTQLKVRISKLNNEISKSRDGGNIHEIIPPLIDFIRHDNTVTESLKSCIDNSDFVLSTSMDDIQVLLVRILKNQQTIMNVLNRKLNQWD